MAEALPIDEVDLRSQALELRASRVFVRLR
jgi:hypothetical protein